MGLDGKFLRTVGAAIAIAQATPATLHAAPKLAPEMTRSGADLIQPVGFAAKLEDEEIAGLRRRAENTLLEFRNAMQKGLSIEGKIELEKRMFDTSKDYGAALRRFKTDRGFPYPGYFTTEEVERLEEAIKNKTLSDTDKQKLLETFMTQARKSKGVPDDTDATIKGQFCGEFPDLCPPLN